MGKSRSLRESFMEYFISVGDPRLQARTKHELFEILFISVCGVMCGSTSFIDIEEFAGDKEEWLRSYLTLKNGIPSHDTFARVLSIVDIKSFEGAFFKWVKEELSGASLKGKHLAIDGKVIRGTSRKFQGSKTLSLVSVFSSELGVVLGQARAEGRGTRETNAVLECLDKLSIEKALISLDAGLASRQVTRKIREKKAHYLVPIKKNQPHSYEELEKVFASKKIKKSKSHTKEKAHGRIEERESEVMGTENLSEMFHNQWKDVKTVFKITRKRTTSDNRYSIQKKDSKGKFTYVKNEQNERTSVEEVFYISSQKITAKEALIYTRKHWAIENNLHWSLDVIFMEDQWKVRDKQAATSLGLIRRLAYNLVKANKSKGSNRVKLKRAAWKDGFLDELIFGAKS